MKEELKKKPETVLVNKDSVEAMADNIAAIAKAARAMETRLTRRALILLINDLTGGSKGVSYANIEQVLKALQDLDVYVKGKK